MTGMSQEEFDARSERGEDAYGLVAEDLSAKGYVFFRGYGVPGNGRWVSPEEQEVLRALDEAIEWARRPSPIPMEPFNDFLTRMGKLGAGPRMPQEWRDALKAGPIATGQAK